MPGYKYGILGSSYFGMTSRLGNGTQFSVFVSNVDTGETLYLIRHNVDSAGGYLKSFRGFEFGSADNGDPTTQTGNNESLVYNFILINKKSKTKIILLSCLP